MISALSQLAPVLNFEVKQVQYADINQVSINERSSILVATHGQFDEDALEIALRSSAAYVGMVGSHRRVDACREYLMGRACRRHKLRVCMLRLALISGRRRQKK